MQEAKASATVIETELKKVEESIESLVDRVVNTAVPSLVATYEKRIQMLEDEKIVLREKIAKCGRKLPDFDKTFRTAMDFLGNPCVLWSSKRIEDKERC